MTLIDDRPVVTVVGLGPAGEEAMTDRARRALAAAPRVLVRTEQHPAAVDLIAAGARALDPHYEASADFNEVYTRIVDDVVATATTHGSVAYAVPGSPFVLEETVQRLRADDRVRLEFVTGMSFLDLCWERLQIDPVTSGVRLIDGLSFATAAAGDHGPFIIGQVYSQRVASEIKLSIDEGPEQPVTILRHLGMADESVHVVPWEDIDRTVELDHLCCIYVPELTEAVNEELQRTVEVIQVLREQCPWDKEQTHQSLARHLIEETYEAIEAIDELDELGADVAAAHLEEELGDVLCQVLFHATLAREAGMFTLADIARTLREKLVHRHPHVFGDASQRLGTADAVVSRWEAIKQAEKGRESVMDGIPKALPALSYATKVERKVKSAGIGFDDVEQAVLSLGNLDDLAADGFGELLLVIARTALAKGVDPEAALRVAAVKLRDRFMAAEIAAAAGGTPFLERSVNERKALFAATATEH